MTSPYTGTEVTAEEYDKLRGSHINLEWEVGLLKIERDELEAKIETLRAQLKESEEYASSLAIHLTDRNKMIHRLLDQQISFCDALRYLMPKKRPKHDGRAWWWDRARFLMGEAPPPDSQKP